MLVRKDEYTSQKIETALIFKQMLGVQDAYEYLLSREVPVHTIERVLRGGERRSFQRACESDNPNASPSTSAKPIEAFYLSSGRRKDVMRMAVVQAALILRPQLGSDRVQQMLRREKLSDDVIARVLRAESGTVRARRDAMSAE